MAGETPTAGRRLPGWLRALVSAALLAGVAFLLDWRRLAEGAARLPAASLAEAAVFCALTLLCLTVRWWAMVRPIVPGGFLWHAGHFWTAGVASLFTPAAVGADLYRIAVLRRGREGGPEGGAGGSAALVGVIARERLVGLLGYCLFYLLCLPALAPLPAPLPEIAVLLAAAAAGLLAALALGERIGGALAGRLPPAWGGRLAGVAAGLGGVSPGRFGLSLGLTLAACATWTAAAAALFRGLGLAAAWPAVGVTGVLAEIARWLPVTVQGLGVRESVFAFGAERFGLDPAAGFLAGALVYLLHTAVLLAAGAAGVLLAGRRA